MMVRYIRKCNAEMLGLQNLPSFSATGSIRGMKDKYFGKDALLVRCGAYIYNVTSRPDIYYGWGY